MQIYISPIDMTSKKKPNLPEKYQKIKPFDQATVPKRASNKDLYQFNLLKLKWRAKSTKNPSKLQKSKAKTED